MDKQRIEPSHFIEVYGTKDEFKRHKWSLTLPCRMTEYDIISQLDHCLKETIEMATLKTVAIFKIRFK